MEFSIFGFVNQNDMFSFLFLASSEAQTSSSQTFSPSIHIQLNCSLSHHTHLFISQLLHASLRHIQPGAV